MTDAKHYGDERDDLLALLRARCPDMYALPECPPEDMLKGPMIDDSRMVSEIERAKTMTDASQRGEVVIVPREWLDRVRSSATTLSGERHPMTDGQRNALAQIATEARQALALRDAGGGS